MGLDFSPFAENANTFMELMGQPVQWLQAQPSSAPTANVDQPWKTTKAQGVAPIAYDVQMAFLPPSQGSLYQAPGSDITSASELGYMSGDVPFTPSLKDTVKRQGKTLSVVRVDTLAPNGLPILHTVYFA